MAPFAPLDCANTAHSTTSTWHAFYLAETHHINMDAPNERVEQHTAFCVFDLQINWP